MESKLKVEAMPDKRRYCDGEEIDLAGLRFSSDGHDVTDAVELEWTPDVKGWPRGRRKMYVKAKLGDDTQVIELRRKQSPEFFIILALLIAALAFGIAMWRVAYSPEPLQTGSMIQSQGDMSPEEAQAMLDEQAEKSQMTVSIAPELELNDDGDLKVDFVVSDGEGSFPQRLEIVQDGRRVFKSGTVMPGYAITWARTDGARIGDATAMVHRVDEETGADVGAPVAIELEVVSGGQG